MKAPDKIEGAFMARHHNYCVRIDEVREVIGGYCSYSECYDEVRKHLTDEFVRGLDRNMAVNKS